MGRQDSQSGSHRFNIGASPTLKRQKDFTQPIFKLVDVLPALSRQLRLDDKAKELSVMSLAEHFIKTGFDGRFAGAIQPSLIKFKSAKRQMLLLAKNGMIASEFSFHTQALLEQLNHYAPQTELRIDSVDIKVGR